MKFILEEEQSFKNKCLIQSLTATSGTDYSLWKITISIKNAVTFETPLRKPDHSWARNSSEKASLFASHLENVFRPNSNTLITDNSLDIQQYINECNQMEIPIRKVKLHEILSIISNLKSKKAPGYDLITAKHLKELPMGAINFMMNIFNACISKCWFPDQWKVAQIKMLLKNGKNTELLESYRPISLLSVLSKVLEIIFLALHHRTSASISRKNTLIF